MHTTLHLNRAACCVKLMSPGQTDSLSLDHCQHGASPFLRDSLSWPGAAVGCSGLLRAPSRIYRSLSVTLLCLQVDGVVPDAEAFPGRDCSCIAPPTCMESMHWCVCGVVEQHDVKKRRRSTSGAIFLTFCSFSLAFLAFPLNVVTC